MASVQLTQQKWEAAPKALARHCCRFVPFCAVGPQASDARRDEKDRMAVAARYRLDTNQNQVDVGHFKGSRGRVLSFGTASRPVCFITSDLVEVSANLQIRTTG
jgi:hypothetical protein